MRHETSKWYVSCVGEICTTLTTHTFKTYTQKLSIPAVFRVIGVGRDGFILKEIKPGKNVEYL